MSYKSKVSNQSSISALLSFGFESEAVKEIFQAIPISVKKLLDYALGRVDQGSIRSDLLEPKGVNHLVFPDLTLNSPSAPEDVVEDFVAAQSTDCWQSETQNPTYGYIHILLPQNSFDPRQVFFNSQLADIFSIDHSTLVEIMECPKTQFLFVPMDIIFMAVHELENFAEEETLRYMRMIQYSPFTEAKLVSIHTRKYFNESGNLQEVSDRKQ